MNVRKRTDIRTHARWATTTVDLVVVDASVTVAILTDVSTTTTTSSSNEIEHTRWANSRTWKYYYTHIPIVCLHTLSNSFWWIKKTPTRMAVQIWRIKHQSLLILKSDALFCVRARTPMFTLHIVNFLFANFLQMFWKKNKTFHWIEINGDNESATNVLNTHHTSLENGSSWFMTEILSSDFSKKNVIPK